ncbi:hypothetical protein FPV67DRAFT_1670087 [Lyophyllum atratum]|nr:hypothetical protein FPV67DRAFT_1670087 [Lyophyllum atratum]
MFLKLYRATNAIVETNINILLQFSLQLQGRRILQMPPDSTSKQLEEQCEEEWKLPPAPPLVKAYEVGLRVFGFPITHEDLQAWAEAHDIEPGRGLSARRFAALKAIGAKLSRHCCRISGIRNSRTGSVSFCIVVGTNRTAEDMQLTQDVDRIKSLYDIIDMPNNWPGWFIPYKL